MHLLWIRRVLWLWKRGWDQYEKEPAQALELRKSTDLELELTVKIEKDLPCEAGASVHRDFLGQV